MKRIPALALILTALVLAAPPAARRSVAQPGGVIHEGLSHSALGGATVSVDPLSRRLKVTNLGSSGQDGVKIEWARGGHGMHRSLPDLDYELASPGSSYNVVVGGTESGAAAVLGSLLVTRQSDGGETMIPSFPTAASTGVWLDLLDEAGKVVYSSCCKGYNIKVSKKVVAAASRGEATQASNPRWLEIDIRSPAGSGNFSVKVGYPYAVIVQDGSSLVECRTIKWSRTNGASVATFDAVSIKGAWPAGSPPGSFTIDAEPVGPPCAGLNCPNGPGTELSVGETALYDQGSSSATEMRAAPKDTVKVHIRESPTLVSLGKSRPMNSLSLDIRESPTLAALTWRAQGTVDGVPDQELWTMSCNPSSSGTQYVPDFSGFGLTDYHVILSSGGAPVADIVDPVGGFTVLTNNPDDEIEVARTSGGPRIIRNCRTPPCPGDPVIVNGVVYVADHIEAEGLDNSGTFSRTVSDVSALDVSSYDAITIYGGTGEPVTPVAGVESPGTMLDFAPPLLSPNPAVGPVRVRFTLPRSGRASVAVTDVAGRRIRTLTDASYPAGIYDLSWDGRDGSGRRVAAGVYFVRLESGSASRTTRMTRLW